MDGADGMAGGMALAGFLAYGVAAFLAGELVFARVFLAFGGAAGGFLIFNFHPARVFMGDGGSIPLGFLFAVWGVAGALKGIWSPLFPVVVLAPFWVDATVTLLRRVLRGESFWKSHRTHYYQRVVQMGWGHRRTALLWYGAMVFCCVFALLFLRTPSLPEGLLSLVLLPLSAVALGWVDWRWARRSPGPGESRLEV
jgi:UDP-N-acetylmuramyl pentapeptide phosphotransferase/UDP-N-acetylglucosamine-1-phosphate transferase